ncbi:Uncharacterised protein [BD1-7 clade bacterium]|uniref:Pilus assembly protein n=1 Tax=BD1-7 clade bacterium TaxID=2029982 RepID=A0A5S9N0X7_9GAMM|nr:Uncharacterised protein [BD1-7 clade bacterium]
MLIHANNRWQACGWHLVLSFFIFVACAAWLYFVWFPGSFIKLGGVHGILLIASVDLVVGPLLTLMIYNPAKPRKELVTDLSIIGVIQLGCLVYGLWAVDSQRPVVQLFVDDYVNVMNKSEAAEAGISMVDLGKFPGPYPKKLFLELPEDKAKMAVFIVSSRFAKGKDVTRRLDLYRALPGTENAGLTARLSELSKAKDGRCYNVKVESVHGTFNGCWSRNAGVISIE